MDKKELIDKTNETIADLVYNKYELLKAYNYYIGKRDPELFKYLEENFGIGSPTSVEFTPLLKKHVDALVGEYLGTPLLPKVTCKDSATIDNMAREKLLAITAGIVNYLKGHLNNSILRFKGGKDIVDVAIKEQLDKLIQEIDLSFISEYEKAALYIILYIMQSRETDLLTKLRLLLTDLLITGSNYFRVKPSFSGTNIEIEVLNPLNTFVDRNPDSPYVKNSNRGVIRKWLTPNQIISKYGREVSKEDLRKLKEQWCGNDTAIYKYVYSSDTTPLVSEDLNEDIGIPGYPSLEQGNTNFLLIPVYDVEWIETDDNFVMLRYSTVRIGDDIFILKGIDKKVIRSHDNPNYCGLSINGVFFLNRTLQPYSLILKCAHLQDRYDLLNYYRDNLIANSGTSGVIMDMAMLPKALGVTWPELVEKWLAYKKQGIQWIDSSQDSTNDGSKPLTTIFNGFDDTVKAPAIQAIELAIQSVELTTSSITGVFRERLNGIEQHDAVSNIKQGVTNSYTVTKHYFQQMDLIACEILLDSLNLAKIVYKKGLTGTLILGNKYQQIFTALPEYFTLTDYDIHITSSTEVMEDLQTLKLMIPEFVKSQALAPDIIFDALTTKSLTDLKYKVKKAMKELKEENNLLNLAQQQIEELSLQLKELLSELTKANSKIKSLDENRMKLELTKIQLEYQVDWYKALTDRTYRTRQLDIEEKRTDVELSQLRDGNPYNDTIRQPGE